MDHMSEQLRIVIADDHPFYREGLATLLERSGIDVVALVPNGESALRAVEEHAPDVVVMDLNMPGMSGTEATRRIAAEHPQTRVLVLSVSAQERDVTEAILAGRAATSSRKATSRRWSAGSMRRSRDSR